MDKAAKQDTNKKEELSRQEAEITKKEIAAPTSVQMSKLEQMFNSQLVPLMQMQMVGNQNNFSSKNLTKQSSRTKKFELPVAYRNQH